MTVTEKFNKKFQAINKNVLKSIIKLKVLVLLNYVLQKIGKTIKIIQHTL